MFVKTSKSQEGHESLYSFYTKRARNAKTFIDIGKNQTEISILLGKNKSFVSREIKRNSQNGEYIPCEAHDRYKNRRFNCRQRKKLDNPDLYECVKDLFLRHQWSPEQIFSRLKSENSNFTISSNTIYREIYNGRFNEKGLSHGNRGAIRKLRHRGKNRHTKKYEERRGKIQISNLITDRPAPANNRERLGDWEADTVMGQTGKACLVTLTDRKSRYLLCKKLQKRIHL